MWPYEFLAIHQTIQQDGQQAEESDDDYKKKLKIMKILMKEHTERKEIENRYKDTHLENTKNTPQNKIDMIVFPTELDTIDDGPMNHLQNLSAVNRKKNAWKQLNLN
jgi:hypothetical protein